MRTSFASRSLAVCTGATLVLLMTGCGAGFNSNAVPIVPINGANNVLTQAEVMSIVTATAASVNVPLVIAVSDRRGQILAVYQKNGAPATGVGNFSRPQRADEVAASLARTAAFFSNDQAPLSSRTVRFISGIHFPPQVIDTESAPLYGIENSNRGCGNNTIFPITSPLHGAGPSLGIQTGKENLLDSNPLAVDPGGVPIFKNNRIAGGVGVVADPSTPNYNAVVEYAAVAGTVHNGFAPTVPYPGAVVIGGVTLPFVVQTTQPPGTTTGAADGMYEPGFNAIASGGPAPEGDLITESASTQGGLTLAQVQQIVQQAVTTGNQTRAAIRLPPGSRARFVIAVADLDGHLLALYRMADATIFSVDVAVAKSRNVIWFSGVGYGDLPGIPKGTAVTNRTIGYGAQPLFPEGIENTPVGPFFGLYGYDTDHPCTQGSQPANANQNGVVFFPGAVPLYINGKMVGGLGVSGDGVDQDDYAAAGGAAGYMAPPAIRADQIFIDNVRLPYQKFPEDPTN